MTDRFEASRRAGTASCLTLLGAIAAAGCGGPQAAPVDTATAQAMRGPPPPAGAEVVPQMFRTLSWIEGRWRGSDSTQRVFYEEYRFVDDSTIVMRSFADSTFAVAIDSSVVALRGRRVENVSAQATWIATTFNGNSVHFAPVTGAQNRLIWERATTGWTARLLSPDAGSPPGQRIHRMTPMSR